MAAAKDKATTLLKKEEHDRVTDNWSYIAENLSDSLMRLSMNYFYERGLVINADYDQFRELRTTNEMIKEFHTYLFRGPSTVYEAFLEACEENRNMGIYECLYISDYDATDASAIDSSESGSGDNSAISSAQTHSSFYSSPPSSLLELNLSSQIIANTVQPVSPDSPIMAKLNKHKSVYTTSFPVRGLALLIINVEFSSRKLQNREGAQHDVDNLSNLYHQLGYNVTVLRNAKREAIITEFENIRHSPALENYGSFVLGFSTHGEGRSYLCCDGSFIYQREIIDYFDSTHCPLLAGKPKFLFFDASSGLIRDRGVRIDKPLKPPKRQLYGEEETYKSTNLSLSDMKIGQIKPLSIGKDRLQPMDILKNGKSLTKLPNRSDFLIAMSTYDNCVSWRRSTHGCWFSRVMVEVFRRHAHDHHVVELLKLVRRKLVQVETKHGFKQVNVTVDSLLKRFYFFPGVGSPLV